MRLGLTLLASEPPPTPPWKGGEMAISAQLGSTRRSRNLSLPSFPRRGRGWFARPFVTTLLLTTPTVAATKAPDPTQPLRQFLAQKIDLKLKRQSATQFSFSSGAWHGTNWTQRARVFSPRRNLFPGTATLLLLTDPVVWDGVGGQLAADATGTTVVMIYDLPNQPLWKRRENGLLGYSLQQALKTGDVTWSLPFPMARAVKCSMDAVQSWSAKSKAPIKKFVLVGFSKRALAAWLVANDPRVKALVSLAYNNLNLAGQARLQQRHWGAFSPRWTQMAGKDMGAKLLTAPVQKVLATWDPYSFRAQIGVPKLLVDATNSDYWTLDSPDAFADELRGPTNWLYLAGAGHTMQGAVSTLLGSSAQWIRRTLEHKPLANPTLVASERKFELHAPGASGATLFYATSANRDFRGAKWNQTTLRAGANSIWSEEKWLIPLPEPSNAKFLATFSSATYPNAGGAGTLQLSSRVAILPLPVNSKPVPRSSNSQRPIR